MEYSKLQALYWFNKAAEQGYIADQVELGNLYMSNIGLYRDKGNKEATYWYKKAAEAKNGFNAFIQLNLGIIKLAKSNY